MCDSLSVGLGYVPKIPILLVKLFNKTKNFDGFNEKFKEVYDNITIVNSELLNEYFNREKDNFTRINKLSSIDMQDFVLNNYKKHRLFGIYGYPSGYFFYTFVKKLLEKINIYDMNEYIVDDDCIYNEWNNTLFPIIPEIYNFFELKHNTKYNKLMIKNFYNDISSISEYYYRIIEIFFEKNNNFNLSHDINKLEIVNNLNINYQIDYQFINYKNYSIENLNNTITIEEIINEPKINYSFGLIIPTEFKDVNLINYSVKVKLNIVIYDNDNNTIEAINLYDGKKWHNKIIEYNEQIYEIFVKTSNKPRINFGNNKIIKIIKCLLYYYF